MDRPAIGLTAAFAAALSLTGARDARAAACGDGPRGELSESISATWNDAGALRLSDGRIFVPAGLRLPSRLDPGLADASRAATTDALAGRALRLGAPPPDRNGRLVGAAHASGTGEGLAAHLVRAGAGFADPAADPPCAALLLGAEAEARAARRGIWAVAGAVSAADRTQDVAARTGLFTVLEGRVLAAGRANGRVYLNFGRRWRDDVTVIIPNKVAAIIMGSGLDPAMLRGTLVRARGIVRADGGPALVIERAGDLERLEANGR